MKPVTGFKRGLAKVRREWLAGHYDRALDAVNKLLEEWPDNPHLLVMWADLVQLQEAEADGTLEEAKEAYRRAAELESDSPAALIELGHFLDAVDDDAEAASKAFEKAIGLCRRLLIEALLGRAKALEERERHREAHASLMEAYWLQLHQGRAANGSAATEILEQLKSVAHTE